MTDTLKDIPEFFETELGESIISRTDALGTFRELGPPDLCHIIKVHNKPPFKEIGSYHYISGIDASSSASLAAYLNSLTYSVDESSSWFTKSNPWRIRSGIYCCYNAFSRVDVRVEVKIPGGVESYYVDVRGERHEANAGIWQETYLSAVLRSILYSDDSYYRLAGYKKVDPILNLAAESRFLEAVETLFWKGWQLGCRPEIQVATPVYNHLTDGVLQYFSQSSRYEPAIRLFSKLHKQDPEIGSLLAACYLGRNEEIKAVKVLHEDLKLAPLSFALIHRQVDFLRSKGQYHTALTLAKYAVDATPSEFLTWEKLTEVYIDIKDYRNALLALNSCPMFTLNERDTHRMPTPLKTHLPIKPDIVSSGIMEEDGNATEAEANTNLKKLPALGLHGTFAKAYALLTKLANMLSWDELLLYRSDVFVMEEEYRKHKANEEHRKSIAVRRSVDEEIPNLDVVEKPSQAAEDEDTGRASFGNKRLCERWLDNLFMVLYEDLRVYTYWRAEVNHYRTQNMAYRKTGTEWELLGELALRLWHEDEAKEAFEFCLDYKFSAKAWIKLLKIYADNTNVQKALLAAVKLTVYHERWYHEIVYPSEIAYYLNQLIRKVGLSKIKNTLTSMNLPMPIQKLMVRYFDYGVLFQVEGYDDL